MEAKDTGPLLATFELIRQAASVSRSLTSLQEAVVKAISEHLPRYDWVGFRMQGICGAAVASRSTIVVDDVNAGPRYLSCLISTRSAIVVPTFVQDRVVGELDIDSHTPAAFTDADREFLEDVVRGVGDYISATQA
jgi:GAF domain-containing protein